MAQGLSSVLLRLQEATDLGLLAPSWPPSEPRFCAYPDFPNSFGETVWKFSGTRQPPHHQADHCRVDERFCASTKPLVILAHPPVLREPGEGPFHHPPAG